MKNLLTIAASVHQYSKKSIIQRFMLWIYSKIQRKTMVDHRKRVAMAARVRNAIDAIGSANPSLAKRVSVDANGIKHDIKDDSAEEMLFLIHIEGISLSTNLPIINNSKSNGQMSENSKQTYGELMAQLNVLQLQILELEQKKLSARIQRTLIGLSKTKDKSRYMRERESQLMILEMIEYVDDVAKRIDW